MSTARYAAVLGAVLLSLATVLQLLLACGLPLGRAAWGGHHRVLPARLRWGSLTAALILAGAAWIVLARVGLVLPGPEPLIVRIGTWAFAAVFVLNTVGNAVSRSPLERTVMAPATALLVVCFVLAGLQGP